MANNCTVLTSDTRIEKVYYLLIVTTVIANAVFMEINVGKLMIHKILVSSRFI